MIIDIKPFKVELEMGRLAMFPGRQARSKAGGSIEKDAPDKAFLLVCAALKILPAC